MLILAAAIVILGIALLIVGLRGRRIDDHPLCSACGFDLTGTLPTGQICPECGGEVAAISPEHPRGKAIRIGHRRKRAGVLLVATLMLMLGLGMGGFGVWSTANQTTLNAHKPTWWLLLDIRGKSAADVEAALVELKTRHDLGVLSREQLLTIVDIALARQADLAVPWVPRWGEFIELAWNTGALSPEQQDRYARNSVRVSLLTRHKVRQGDELPLAASLENRVGPGTHFEFFLVLKSVSIESQPVNIGSFSASGGMSCPTAFPAPSPFQMDITSTMLGKSDIVMFDRDRSPVRAAEGVRTVTSHWHICIARGTPSRMGMSWTQSSGGFGISSLPTPTTPPLAEWDITSETSVTVVGPDAEVVELVTDPALAQRVRDSISISISTTAPGPFRSMGSADAYFTFTAPPVGLAFTAFFQTSRGESASSIVMSQAPSNFPLTSGASLTTRSSLQPGDTVDITLKPNPKAAGSTIHLDKIWGEEIVIKNVIVGGPPVGMLGNTPGTTAPPALFSLNLPEKERFPGNHAFRSVALHDAHAYVGDRNGDIYIFSTDREGSPFRESVNVLANVFDGQCLRVVENTLLCTNHGRIIAFDLADPGRPKPLDESGPPRRSRTNALVLSGQHAFLLGENLITCFDIADPARPGLISTSDFEGYHATGCARGNHLYVAQLSLGRGKSGIAVYDVSDPLDIQSIDFVPTSESVMALHLLPNNRLLAVLDAPSRTLAGAGPHSSTVIYDISDPRFPKFVRELGRTGGRTSAVLSSNEGVFLASPGALLRFDQDTLTSIFALPYGSNLDGASYTGDSRGGLLAIVHDGEAIVVEAPKPPPEQTK